METDMRHIHLLVLSMSFAISLRVSDCLYLYLEVVLFHEQQ